jgi:hypothetical protein
MTSPFHDALLAASQSVDDIYGEAFTFRPMARADVNDRPAADPDRAETAITAVFIDFFARAGSGPVRTPGVAAEWPGHTSARPQISFAAAALPYAARKDDRLVRVADARVFAIAEIRRGADPRLACDVNEVHS